MEKRIEIQGKRNRDALAGKPTRRTAVPRTVDLSSVDERTQVTSMNRILLGESFELKGQFEKEISRKISGYRAQDRQNGVYDCSHFVLHANVVEMLVCSRLRCFYCTKFCPVLFEKPNDPSQWTLDRIDNEQGHNVGNVKVSCLECNVKRGTMRMERFKEGRIIRIQKEK